MIITAATNNRGKLDEIKYICGEFGIDCKSLAESGITSDPEETGQTLRENAAIKARAVFRVTGTPVISDDSGLFVDALGGLPGVFSARYAPTELERIDKLLREMDGIRNRSAQFRTAICFINEYGKEEYFNGFVGGEIGFAPQGENGFGYDPIFIYTSENGERRTFAEISAFEKNIISHRAKALFEFKAYLADCYGERGDKKC
jgi:XTP/dITP diphosphohydrolase